MIPSIVLKSVLWRCSESAWTFWKFQLLRFSLRPIVDPKQPLLSVRNVCPFLGKDIHPITIPSLVMKSALWRGPESARAFCNFQKSVNSLHPNGHSSTKCESWSATKTWKGFVGWCLVFHHRTLVCLVFHHHSNVIVLRISSEQFLWIPKTWTWRKILLTQQSRGNSQFCAEW